MLKKMIFSLFLFYITFTHSVHADNNFTMKGDWPYWEAQLVDEYLTFNMLNDKGELTRKVNIISNEQKGNMIAFHSDDFYVYGIINQINDHFSFCGYDYKYQGDQFEVQIQINHKSYQGCIKK